MDVPERPLLAVQDLPLGFVLLPVDPVNRGEKPHMHKIWNARSNTINLIPKPRRTHAHAPITARDWGVLTCLITSQSDGWICSWRELILIIYFHKSCTCYKRLAWHEQFAQGRQETSAMYLLTQATRWQSYKSTTARGAVMWFRRGILAVFNAYIHTRTHTHTHLTWASACMKMNSHFLAKALCSRARFSCRDQSEAALEKKVVLNSRPSDDYIFHSTWSCAAIFLDCWRPLTSMSINWTAAITVYLDLVWNSVFPITKHLILKAIF